MMGLDAFPFATTANPIYPNPRTMSDFQTISREAHDQLVITAYKALGYKEDEAALGTKLAAEAARHGIRTHHALKALHLDHLFGSAIGGCVPGAEIEVLESRFPASEIWNANKIGRAHV